MSIKDTTAPKWKNFNRGDHVVVNERGTSATRGRYAICIADNTETQFGHKHVEIQFDDNGKGTCLRTYELDLVKSWEDFRKENGLPLVIDDAVVSETNHVKIDLLGSPADAQRYLDAHTARPNGMIG